jgi:hypothetical protein
VPARVAAAAVASRRALQPDQRDRAVLPGGGRRRHLR